MENKLFIAIAGNIGSGKTTLTSMLAESFGWHAHFESVSDNPYLEDFYKDMHRWAFPLQVYFLNHRFSAHREIFLGSRSAIQDRSIYEDAHIFARNLFEEGKMEKRDYQNYLALFQSFCEFLPPPDLIVYLRRSVPKLKERILKRGRSFEKNIPDSYLTHLNRYYDDWMDQYSLGKKLILETDGLDFLSQPKDYEWIASQITEHLDQPQLFWKSSEIKSPGLVSGIAYTGDALDAKNAPIVKNESLKTCKK